jgi:glycerophosphoryl diester phosphodiesterase
MTNDERAGIVGAMKPLHAGVIVVMVVALAATGMPEPAERPVPHTHAHNDYEHPHPLFDALHQGFVGVEADVYLVGNELRVSHEKKQDWSAVPTLEEAYLRPLGELKARRKSGGIYPDGTRLMLLIDIKTDAAPTYQRVHEVLASFESAHPGLFTVYRDGAEKRGAVDVVTTGNRPREVMKGQAVRYATYDGRMEDVGGGESAGFISLVSDNWNNVFGNKSVWDGTGEMPPAVRAKLKSVVADVHREGRTLRFWNVPKDSPETWGPLLDAGVDWINTDDLEGLAKFLRARS